MTKHNDVFTKIYINGSEMTNKIRSWSIEKGHGNDLYLSYFPEHGDRQKTLLKNCSIEPTLTEEEGTLFIQTKRKTHKVPIQSAVTYGGRYTVIQYLNSNKIYIMKTADVRIHRVFCYQEHPVFQYFLSTMKSRIHLKKENDPRILENVLRQLEQVPSLTGTALYAYCTKSIQSLPESLGIIYPFGINESQIQAVENAFKSQISIVEGPPGTGKTQTILNIIANILLQNKSVAILSSNNSAVENVYEKLAKYDLDYLTAKLGSHENKEIFFNTQKDIPPKTDCKLQKTQALLAQVKKYLYSQSEIARLRMELNELETERSYLRAWRTDNSVPEIQHKRKYKLSTKKLTDRKRPMTPFCRTS